MKRSSDPRSLAFEVRQARGKPPAERIEIAKRLGVAPVTLTRYIRMLNTGGVEGLRRKERKDRWRPRKLTQAWASLTITSFFLRESRNYRAVHAEVSQRCARRGLPRPSYYWCRRQIDSAVERATAGTRIERLGNFRRFRKIERKPFHAEQRQSFKLFPYRTQTARVAPP